MYRIRRVGVLRTATVFTVMYSIFAIPFALLFLVAGLGQVDTGGFGAAVGGVMAIGVILILLLYLVLIWAFTALACVVYNLAARWVGGVTIQLELEGPMPHPPASAPLPDAAPPVR